MQWEDLLARAVADEAQHQAKAKARLLQQQQEQQQRLTNRRRVLRRVLTTWLAGVRLRRRQKAAAACIARGWRAHRKRMTQAAAAARVQSMFRGFYVRKKFLSALHIARVSKKHTAP